MRYSRNMWRLAVVLVSLLALAACSGTTSSNSSSTSNTATHSPASSTAAPQSAASSTGVAQSTVCDGVTKINQALVSLSTTTVDTTVGDVRAAQLKVIAAANAIHARVPTADGTLLSQITTANAQLTAKLAGYTNSTPIGHTSDTVADIKTKAADAQAKTTELAGKLNCTV